MILQALASYYERLNKDPHIEVARFGFSPQKIHFLLVIDRNGRLCGDPVDIRDVSERKPQPRVLIVPFDASLKRTVAVTANFLWDNTSYVLGADAKENPERARRCFAAFRSLHHSILDGVDDPGAEAILRFVDAWKPDDAASLPFWEELAGSNVVFQLEGENLFLHQRTALRDAWLEYLGGKNEDTIGTCLITGKTAPIAKIHPAIKGVRGAQSSGAALVSFNLDAFSSYGKRQNLNAPVGNPAAFAYTTAINHLLSDPRRKVQIGDASTVFWTERPTNAEDLFSLVFNPPDTQDSEELPAEDAERVKVLRDFLDALKKVKTPRGIEDDPEVPFYILGLSPNAARLSVRFWHVSTVGEMASRMAQHFDDLTIAPQFENEPEYPSARQLLRETAPLRKYENISPLLSGAFMRAILTGESYPRSLLSAVIGRIRADQTINYYRAALLKAFLSREFRLFPNRKTMEVSMALNPESTNTAYRLGRLFAVLEKAQKDANPVIKATIKNRFFSSAVATPRSVFPRLISMAQHHIGKIDPKFAFVSDKQIECILQEIDAFPAHLSLEEQGLFILGYYHQRQALFKKSEKEDEGALASDSDE